ncbi:MAG: hypothetical protein MRY72_14195 [Aquisalinus sp.]|nr:hypothetical protein [Aquisalinus sp.]
MRQTRQTIAFSCFAFFFATPSAIGGEDYWPAEWPAELLLENETSSLMTETQRLISNFGYDSDADEFDTPESLIRRLRRDIVYVQERLLLPATGRTSTELNDLLQKSTLDGTFLCPLKAQAIHRDSPNWVQNPEITKTEVPYTFVLRGDNPTLFLAQLIERLDDCAVGHYPLKSSEVQADVTPYHAFLGEQKPAFESEAAYRKLNSVISGIKPVDASAGQSITIPDLKLTVLGKAAAGYKFSIAPDVNRSQTKPYLVAGSVPDRTGCDADTACLSGLSGYLDLGHKMMDLGKFTMLSDLTMGRDSANKLNDPLINHQIEFEITLPIESGPATAEDLYRYILETNPHLGVYNSEITYSETRFRFGNANVPSAASTATAGICSDEGVDAQAYADCIKARADEIMLQLRKALGWPTKSLNVFPRTTSTANSNRKVYIFDDSLSPSLQRVTSSSSLVEKGIARILKMLGVPDTGGFEIRQLVSKKAHRYFEKGKAVCCLRNSKDRPPLEPGHAIFAAGLLSGALNEDWGGMMDNNFSVSIHSASDFRMIFIPGWKDYIAGQFRSGQFRQLPYISVFIGDTHHCEAGTSGNSGSGPWVELHNFLKEELRAADLLVNQQARLLVVSAPYHCAEGNQEYSFSVAKQQYLGCERNESAGFVDTGHIAPFICFARDGSNHVIAVAALNEALNAMFDKNVRPTKYLTEDEVGINEKYFLAPGCGLLSADVDLETAYTTGDENEFVGDGVRLRDHGASGCGSSFAAPMVAALITRLNFNQLMRLPPAVDVKAMLAATASPTNQPDKFYGIVNWRRAVETEPQHYTFWFDGFPGFLRTELRAAETEERRAFLGDVCTCYESDVRNHETGKSTLSACLARSETSDANVAITTRCAAKELFISHQTGDKRTVDQMSYFSNASSQNRILISVRRNKLGRDDTWDVISVGPLNYGEEISGKPDRFESGGLVTLANKVKHDDQRFDPVMAMPADCVRPSGDEDNKACLELCQYGQCLGIDHNEFTHLIFRGWRFEERQPSGF